MLHEASCLRMLAKPHVESNGIWRRVGIFSPSEKQTHVFFSDLSCLASIWILDAFGEKTDHVDLGDNCDHFAFVEHNGDIIGVENLVEPQDWRVEVNHAL